MSASPLSRLATGAAAAAAALLLSTSSASASTAWAPEPPRPAFYEAPATLPEQPGTLIRTEPMTFALDPLQISSLAVTSTRILYTSTNHAGENIAVSGSVIVPTAPWLGVGQRPVISVAAGTQGLADRCAPSRQFSEGFEYETHVISGMLARGYAVVMTDYEGLGTEGVHTYMNRESQGHAVLDAARAALTLDGSGLSAANPVGLYGYSQGGGGAASAAELAESYAPDLNVKAAAVGAVPADLTAVMAKIDGSQYAEFMLYGLVGLAAANDIDLDPYLNDYGKQVITEAQADCTSDSSSHANVTSASMTASGQSMIALSASEPFASATADNRIGDRKPSMPVHVSQSYLDDVIPYAVTKQLAADWCTLGASVEFSTNFVPTHVGGAPVSSAEGLLFFEQQFAGLPAHSTCSLMI